MSFFNCLLYSRSTYWNRDALNNNTCPCILPPVPPTITCKHLESRFNYNINSHLLSPKLWCIINGMSHLLSASHFKVLVVVTCLPRQFLTLHCAPLVRTDQQHSQLSAPSFNSHKHKRLLHLNTILISRRISSISLNSRFVNKSQHITRTATYEIIRKR